MNGGGSSANTAGLPAPSSLLRRNNGKRLSMASATRSSLIGNANHINTSTTSYRNSNLVDNLSIGSIPSSVKRRSLLSTPASNRRRQSLGSHSKQHLQQPQSQPQSQQSQQSQSQPQSQQSQHNTSTASTPYKYDNRPLRDKNYQHLIQNEIFEFLTTNKFELEMNHPLTSKTLRQPTQKDFMIMFQFLYNKIDPYYRFSKPIEQEVFTLLKVLNYPYLEGITRSQISAVGGNYWPNFLGILYWLVKLNLQMIEINQLNNIYNLEDELDQIFIDYTKKSYVSFINDKDDFSEFFEEMKQNFQKFNAKIEYEITHLNNYNQELVSKFNELNDQLTTLNNADKKSKALENDLIKFKAYIETMESRKSKWREILDKIELEIDNYQQELSNINDEKQKYEIELQGKGLNSTIINNLINERDGLSRNIEFVNHKLQEVKLQINYKETELRKNYESLENFLKQYNNIIYKIQLNQLNNYKFEIQLNQDVWDFSKSFTPSDILHDNKNLKDEKIELLKFRSEINNRINSLQDQSIKLQEQNDLLNETLLDQREELETLESKISINKSIYDEIYETMINDNTAYSTQIEKLDKELRSIKINTNQEFIEIENKYQNITIEFDELNHEITKLKNYLHDNIQKIIETTINFKLNIQLNLVDLEEMIVKELELELKNFKIFDQSESARESISNSAPETLC